MEVSWSPPAHQGAFNITGYRIFYGSDGENVSIPSLLTLAGLMVTENYGGRTVSLRSESGVLFSEHINVTVGKLLPKFFNKSVFIFFAGYGPFCLAGDKVKYPCSREIGATVGVMVCLIATVTAVTITVVLCWWR